MTAKDLDTGTTDLLASLDEGVLTLTLNRPDARNAMSGPMTAALAEQLAAAELDHEVKCIVLTGAGKGFCAGGDVKGMAASGDGTVGLNTIDGAIHRQRVNQRATAGKLFSMPKPTIAALPGAAAGAGLSLALACDLRIMSSSAILTTAFARVGFSGPVAMWIRSLATGGHRTRLVAHDRDDLVDEVRRDVLDPVDGLDVRCRTRQGLVLGRCVDLAVAVEPDLAADDLLAHD